VGSDHQLIAASVRLKLKASKRHSPVECFDTDKLDDPVVAYEYSAEISRWLDPVIEACRNSDPANTDETWEQVVEAFNTTSREVLGKKRGRPVKPWLSAETTKLAEERRELKPRKRQTVMNTRHYNYLCREIARKSKIDKNKYLQQICHKVETSHMQGRVKEVFEAVRKITGKQASRVCVVKDQTGEVITDQGVRSRWFKHFKQLYNLHRDTDDTVFSELPGGRLP